MRHARKAAAPATMALLLYATLCASSAAVAQAIDSPGGASAPVAALATRGTGGTVYIATPPKPAVTPPKTATKSRTRKPSSRKPVAHTPSPRKPKPAPRKPVPPAPPVVGEVGAPTPAQTVAEGAVFPVVGAHSFGNAENRFGAGRAGHIHEGQDVLASEGLAVVAPLAGTIITTAYQAGGAGWYAAEHTAGGLDFFYAHCQASSLAVSTGQAVSAGQAICSVGQTGDATGPHLHFEVWVGGWQAPGGHPIDPLPYLEAWELSGGGS
jgi:murein DD-endopeptidase MepM/ murein hydrolase activator NlpD